MTPGEGMKPRVARSARLEHAIYRVDDEQRLLHGWMVKMDRAKIAYRKLFSDADHHGREGALANARAFRDGVVQQQSSGARRTCPQAMRAPSIIVGLERYCTDDTLHLRQELQHWRWRVAWKTPEGIPQQVEFSVREHGDEAAFRMALDARRMAIGSLGGVLLSATSRRWLTDC